MNSLSLIQFSYEESVQLGALYLAAGLESACVPFEIKIYPLYKHRGCCPTINELYAFIARSKRIIAVGCWSDILPMLLLALERVKKTFPEKIIILGGVGPTEVAEELLSHFGCIDYVIKGCGMKTLPKLVRKILKRDAFLSDIDGLVYRFNGNVISNNDRGHQSLIPERPPYPRIKNIQSCKAFNVATSSGCPYHCTFCNVRHLLSPKLVFRDVRQVIHELEVIKELRKGKPYEVAFRDEGFVVNRQRVLEFCRLLRARKFIFPWTCYGRIDRVDEEMLERMAASGCQCIFYGVESGSNAVLKRIKKGFLIEEAVRILKLSKIYIKKVIASFIYLYPFETVSDFNETVFFARYLKSSGIQVNLQPLIPVRHSEIYSEFSEELVFSDEISTPSHPRIGSLPKPCRELIKRFPGVFYYYHFYRSPVWRMVIQKQRLIDSLTS